MNRNNGLEIGRRLMVLRDYLFANADKTHAVSIGDIQKEYYNAEFYGQNGDTVSVKTIYRDLDALRDYPDRMGVCGEIQGLCPSQSAL